jgi:hypothetical protein
MKSVRLLRRECVAFNYIYLLGERSVGDIAAPVRVCTPIMQGSPQGGRWYHGGVWSGSKNGVPIRVTLRCGNVEEAIVGSPRV